MEIADWAPLAVGFLLIYFLQKFVRLSPVLLHEREKNIVFIITKKFLEYKKHFLLLIALQK